MAKLLSGKEVTASLNEEIRKKVETLNAHQITPKLGIIRIGDIPVMDGIHQDRLLDPV